MHTKMYKVKYRKVAPQEENGRVYIGGADQIKIMDHVMPSWVIEKRII